MGFDLRAPTYLKEAQQWMASIIVRPIDMQNNMHPISPTGNRMEEEAMHYIAPSWSLKPHQRIELYNQQYWWRLLNVLHDMFPLVVRLFGYADFNQTIGFPYLVKYPPKHWSLNALGENFCRWVLEEYPHDDRQLIYDAAAIDWGYDRSFIAAALPPLSIKEGCDLSSIATSKFFLQPWLFFFEFSYDLFKFRDELLEHTPDAWIDMDFPPLDKGKKHFALCRAPSGHIIWSEISEGEFLLLNRFKKGASITDACKWLEKQNSEIVQQALEQIQMWFHQWVARGWFSLEQQKTLAMGRENG